MRRLSMIVLVGVLVVSSLPLGAIWAGDSSTSAQTMRQDEAAPIYTIGEVQGSVTGDPLTFRSPLFRERVQVSGVVTNLLFVSTDNREVHGFFLQSTDENCDGDPMSSDGIQAIIGAPTEFDGYTPVVGDIITIEGKVDEFYYNTRLIDLSFVRLDGHVDDPSEAISDVEINPVGTAEEIALVYETLEGMRVSVPAGSLVVSATHIFISTNDTEVYVIRGDHPVAQREDPFTRRVFLDAHELDDGEPGDNPYRISVEANILKGQADDYSVNLPAYNTYDVFTTPLVGNLVFAFERYTLQIEALPTLESPLSPTDNAPVTPADRAAQFSIATFNVENLYDYYNDAFDQQDNPGNALLNYVPLSFDEYAIKVNKIAQAIVGYLHSPDIIALQELEDQDVCTGGGQLTGMCGNEADNADGLPDVLQDVAAQIAELTEGQIVYSVALDRDSSDDRGITQGYMYRADRVEIPAASADNPVLGSRPDDPDARFYEHNQEVSNPKSLNKRFGPGTPAFDRPALVGLFRIHRNAVGSDDYIELYLSNNHFKSDPTSFQGIRQQQSQYNVGLIQALQAENPDLYGVVLGDLNSFPESEEISYLEPTLDNLWDQIPLESRYTYIFAGQTQSLDYIYATPNLVALLSAVRVAHFNSDFSYTFDTDITTGIRAADHDPTVATFNFPE